MFLHQAKRVAIGARDQLRATLYQVTIARIGADSAADAIARLEHRYIRSRLPQPIRRG
jgi:hypothetical protein